MFQNSLNGLTAYSRALDTVGHNLSNSENVGYKKMRLHFSDVLTSATGGGGGGVSAPTSFSEFKQGNIVDSTNPLDMAIRGNGFFQVTDDTTGETFYTRNGQFRLKIASYADSADIKSQKSYLVNAAGNYLMGWQTGQPSTGPTSPLVISHDTSDGKPTTTLGMNINLESKVNVIADDKTFDPNTPYSYNWATSVKVFDNDGQPHDLKSYFVKKDTNQWEVYTRLDAGLIPGETEPQPILFSDTSNLKDFTPMTRSFTLPAKADGTIPTIAPITIDLTGSTQFNEKSTLNEETNDGYAFGYLQNFRVEYDGTIVGDYSNGFASTLGRVALARFTSPEGLLPVGGNLWAESPDSGTLELWPDIATAAASTSSNQKLEGWGAIQTKAIEQSTTETASDLVDMVVMQRNYQANAKGIETQDKMIESLLNIR